MKSITVIWKDLATEKQTETVFYTNNTGEGLFELTPSGTYNQLAGNGQFFARSPMHMMRRLRHMYEGQIVRMVRGSASGWY